MRESGNCSQIIFFKVQLPKTTFWRNQMNESYVICRGSLMDGVDRNLLAWCGLSDLTEDQEDKLWNSITELSLLESCNSCEVISTGEFDEVPGQSDEFFKVVSDDIPKLKEELRAEINDIVGF